MKNNAEKLAAVRLNKNKRIIKTVNNKKDKKTTETSKKIAKKEK